MEAGSGFESGLVVPHPTLGGNLLWSEGVERQQEGDFNLQAWHAKQLFGKPTNLHKQKNLVCITGQPTGIYLKWKEKSIY